MIQIFAAEEARLREKYNLPTSWKPGDDLPPLPVDARKLTPVAREVEKQTFLSHWQNIYRDADNAALMARRGAKYPPRKAAS